MIGVVVSGACGKMGTAIIRRIQEDGGLTLAGALERPGHPALGGDVKEFCGAVEAGVRIASELESVPRWDVLVEFASPEAALSHLPVTAREGRPAVVGATGFTPGQSGEVEAFGKEIPLLVSPNMSLGVTILHKVAAEVARCLGEDFDAEIFEMHHRLKKDAPSGTASRLAEVIARAKGLDPENCVLRGRRGLKARVRGEIGVQSARGGTVTGEHTVIFAGDSERIELVHRAENRDIFVFGTLRAVKFVAGASPGLYSMEDVIGWPPVRKGDDI